MGKLSCAGFVGPVQTVEWDHRLEAWISAFRPILDWISLIPRVLSISLFYDLPSLAGLNTLDLDMSMCGDYADARLFGCISEPATVTQDDEINVTIRLPSPYLHLNCHMMNL